MDKTLIRKKLFVIIELFLIIFLIPILSCRVGVQIDNNYYTKEEVALYIKKYDKLPNNFLTKKEAYKKFETNSAIISNDMNIGGDIFKKDKQPGYSDWIGNYEDLDGITLYECDIYLKDEVNDLIRDNKRGKSRLVYSIDGDFVYYTENHYGENSNPGFNEITMFEINNTSNIFIIIESVLIVLTTSYSSILIFLKKDINCRHDLKQSIITTVTLIIYLVLLPFYLIYYVFKKIFKKDEEENQKLIE